MAGGLGVGRWNWSYDDKNTIDIIVRANVFSQELKMDTGI